MGPGKRLDVDKEVAWVAPTSPGRTKAVLAASSALFWAPIPSRAGIQVPLLTARKADCILSRASYEWGSWQILPPAPLNPVVFITWAICLCWMNMTICYCNSTMKKGCFYFSLCHFVLLGWHLKEEKKRQKATTNGISDEKGEAKLPFLTHFRN